MPSRPPTQRPSRFPGLRGSGANPETDRRRAALLAIAFFCIVAVGIWHHEMWRDEWHAWMLARDVTSLGELLSQVRVEGHMPGWYLILFALGRFTRDPATMQVAHLAIATGAVYMLGRYAPFPWILKVLMAFGYFLAYEYAVLARPYALGVLALFTFCALFPRRDRDPGAVFGALLLLGVTSLYGVIIAGAACGMLLLEASTASTRSAWPPVGKVGARLGLVAWATGGVAAAVIAREYPMGSLRGVLGAPTLPGLSRWALATTASRVTRGYLPFPDLSASHLWDTHIISADSRAGLAVLAAIGLILVASGILILIRTPFVLFFYLVGTGGLLLFGHLIFGGFLRHHGQLFLLFIACLWLASLEPPRWQPPPWMERWAGIDTPWAMATVTGILAIQLASAAILYGADLRRPFSAAPLAAEFIRDQGLEGLPMAASPAPPASSIAGALDRPIHYLAVGSPGTFIRWTGYHRGIDGNLSMAFIRPFLDDHPSDVLIILGAPFEEWDDDLEVEELARFDAGLEARESFVLYRVRGGGS